MLTARDNPYLFGHTAAEAAFDEALAGGRMHHAWLIAGPPGIGKATLAYRFARRLFAGPGRPAHDPALPMFRRVARDTHADLLTIERTTDTKGKRRAEIVVDTVRAVPAFLHLTPVEGGWRVVVVDEAETLNRNASNALLKVLEEPPARAVLVLACAAPGRLPATIRSRCRLLRLHPLALADMAAALGQVGPETDWAAIIPQADGAPGRALALAARGDDVVSSVAQVFETPAMAFPDKQALADKLARAETGYADFMDAVRDRLAVEIRDAAASGVTGWGARQLAGWVDLWMTLGRLQDETERFHLDQRQAIVMAIETLAQ